MMEFLKSILRKKKNKMEKLNAADAQRMAEIENSKKYQNILSFSNTIILSHDLNKINIIIKTLTEKIVVSNVLDLFYTSNKDGCIDLKTETLKNLICEKNEVLNDLFRDILYKTIPCHAEIDLAADPVIPLPWYKDRFFNALNNIGTEENPWRQDNNHRLQLWLPVGVSFVHSGNHSIYSGNRKRMGVITINTESNRRHSAHDITNLYRHIFFDGTYYKWKKNGDIIGKATSFEFGCIFEIGRLLWKEDICFKNVKIHPYDEYEIFENNCLY